MMAELKTRPNQSSVDAFLNTVAQKWKREEARVLIDLFSSVIHAPPIMWGSSIIGFGEMSLKYASGRELDWFIAGFSPRKASFSIYLHRTQAVDKLLPALGKHKSGKGCIYINRLSDIDLQVLEKMVVASLN